MSAPPSRPESGRQTALRRKAPQAKPLDRFYVFALSRVSLGAASRELSCVQHGLPINNSHFLLAY